MSSQGLTHYYHRAKQGLMGINPHEATQLGEDWMIAGATGAVLGLMSAATGGMDLKIAGLTVPKDGLAAFALALGGLTMGSKELKVASIAAGGAASSRVFEGFFKKSFGAHGDFDGNDIPFGADPMQLGSGGVGHGFGWGAERDRLIEAAANL